MGRVPLFHREERAMLKVSQLMNLQVLKPKKKDVEDFASLSGKELARVGRVRQVVFSPTGDRVVGLLVRRPDVAGMVKREDAFLALDSFAVGDPGLVITRLSDGLDGAAVERLSLDWDRCILWTGMDAKTTDGKVLGWVADVAFSPKSGLVEAFYVGDGSVSEALVGDVEIPRSMLVGYKDGYMLVSPEAAGLSLNGGLAAKAGESYGKARQEGREAVAKAGKAAGEAVEAGARGVGRMIGKAKKSDPQKAVKKQLGKTRGMFGAFMDEYKKASK